METLINFYLVLWFLFFCIFILSSMANYDVNIKEAKLLAICAFIWPIPSIILYLYKLFK